MGILLKGKKVRCGFGHFWQWLMHCWSSVNWVEVLERLIKVAESGTEQRRMSLLSAVLSSGFQWKSQEKIVADSRLAILVVLLGPLPFTLYWTDTLASASITPPIPNINICIRTVIGYLRKFYNCWYLKYIFVSLWQLKISTCHLPLQIKFTSQPLRTSSQTIFCVVPLIKLDSQLSCCAFFFQLMLISQVIIFP